MWTSPVRATVNQTVMTSALVTVALLQVLAPRTVRIPANQLVLMNVAPSLCLSFTMFNHHHHLLLHHHHHHHHHPHPHPYFHFPHSHHLLRQWSSRLPTHLPVHPHILYQLHPQPTQWRYHHLHRVQRCVALYAWGLAQLPVAPS